MIDTGIYEPNEPGARTLKEARPMYRQGGRVTIHVTRGAKATVALFFGGELVYEGPMPAELVNESDLYRWASTYDPESIHVVPNGQGAGWSAWYKTVRVDGARSYRHTVVLAKAILLSHQAGTWTPPSSHRLAPRKRSGRYFF